MGHIKAAWPFPETKVESAWGFLAERFLADFVLEAVMVNSDVTKRVVKVSYQYKTIMFCGFGVIWGI